MRMGSVSQAGFAVARLVGAFFGTAFFEADFFVAVVPAATFFTAAFFAVAFFAAAFFGTAGEAAALVAADFFDTAFFGTAFLAGDFFGTAFLGTAFLAGDFFEAAFFGTAFFTAAFFAAEPRVDSLVWAVASTIPGNPASMLRRAGTNPAMTTVALSPIFMTLRALGGGGSAISRRGTYTRTSSTRRYAPWDE